MRSRSSTRRPIRRAGVVRVHVRHGQRQRRGDPGGDRRAPGRINVYLVGLVDGSTSRGNACIVGGGFVAIAAGAGAELLAHELGPRPGARARRRPRRRLQRDQRHAFGEQRPPVPDRRPDASARTCVRTRRSTRCTARGPDCPSRDCDRDTLTLDARRSPSGCGPTARCRRIDVSTTMPSAIASPARLLIAAARGAGAPRSRATTCRATRTRRSRRWMTTSCVGDEARALRDALQRHRAELAPAFRKALADGPAADELRVVRAAADARYDELATFPLRRVPDRRRERAGSRALRAHAAAAVRRRPGAALRDRLPVQRDRRARDRRAARRTARCSRAPPPPRRSARAGGGGGAEGAGPAVNMQAPSCFA